jgi:signal transduction histidine kinase
MQSDDGHRIDDGQRPAHADALVGTLRHQPPMIAYWGADRCNLFASRAYSEWYDADPTAMTGADIRDVLGPEATDRGMPHVAAALAGEGQAFDRTTVDSKGNVHFTEGTYAPHITDGVVQGFFSVVTDTTARVLADAATRAALEPALLKRERERIAADLHDKVIQRLYATTLELASAAKLAEPDIAARMDSSIDGIDAAIIELRSSIFNLTHQMDAAQVTTAVAEIAGRAATALGFTPRVTLSGSLDLTAAVSVEILSVLTEALSNVAKHAQASGVDITIRVDDRGIDLEIADDGLGISRLDRSSGLANMRARAEQLGGTFTWRNNQPSGTIVEWHAPAEDRQDFPAPAATGPTRRRKII